MGTTVSQEPPSLPAVMSLATLTQFSNYTERRAVSLRQLSLGLFVRGVYDVRCETGVVSSHPVCVSLGVGRCQLSVLLCFRCTC